jgi:UDP-N-acetylmuramoyl-tripeptide--D-alanyl-D-alanine ligase
MASNAAAALCVANACQLEIGRSVEALRGFGASVGRGAVNRLGDADNPLVLIDESYNANPASMRAALEVFGSHPQDRGRKVLVLGDMLELGTASAALHAELAGPVTESGADLVFLAGRHMASLAGALGPDRVMLHAPEVADLTQAVLDQLANGDTVMVKGSNGVGLSGLVVQIRSRFGAPGAAK